MMTAITQDKPGDIVFYHFSIIKDRKQKLVSRPAFIVGLNDGKADLQIVVNPRTDRQALALGYDNNPGFLFKEGVEYSEEPAHEFWSDKRANA